MSSSEATGVPAAEARGRGAGGGGKGKGGKGKKGGGGGGIVCEKESEAGKALLSLLIDKEGAGGEQEDASPATLPSANKRGGSPGMFGVGAMNPWVLARPWRWATANATD